MKLDLSKLTNVKHLSSGKTTVQCPACAVGGDDAKGEHLAIFADGKFGCVVHAKDKEHNKLIIRLTGSNDRGDGGSGCRHSVKPMRVAESTVLMGVGRLGRVESTPCQPSDQTFPRKDASATSPEVDECRPARSDPAVKPEDNDAGAANSSEDITNEMLREFLGLPAMAA